MSKDKSETETLKRSGGWLRVTWKVCLVILVAVSLIGLWEMYLASFDPMSPREKDLVAISGPFLEDGFPDYAQAIHDRMKEGVQPSDNCVVALAELIGPTFVIEHVPLDYYDQLGMNPPSGDGPFFVNWTVFLKAEGLDSGSQELQKAEKTVFDNPWKRKEFPVATNWLEKNEKVWPQILKVANRTQYYFPLIMMDESNYSIEGIVLQPVQHMRSVSEFVSCRGYAAIEEGDYEKAAECSSVLLKISLLADLGQTSIEGAIACLIWEDAFKLESQLVNRVDWNVSRMRQRMDELEKFQPKSRYADRMNHSDRYLVLEGVRQGIRGRLNLGYPHVDGRAEPEVSPREFAYIDMETLFRSINKNIDRIIELTDPANRDNLNKERISELSHLLHHMGIETWQEQWRAKLAGRKARSRLMADSIVAARLPYWSSFRESENKRFAFQRISKIGWAALIYEKENGALPTSLTKLNGISTEDPFSLKGIQYFLKDGKAQIYSRGKNGRDEQNPQLPSSGHDHENTWDYERLRLGSDDVVLVIDRSKKEPSSEK